MKKRVKVEFTGGVKDFLDENPDKKYFVCGETSHINSHTYVIKDTTLTDNQVRMRDDSDGFNKKLNISIPMLYEEFEIDREEISFDSEESLKTWLDANKGVKLFLDKDPKGASYIINTEKEPYQYCRQKGHSDDMDNLWHWRVFYLEASVKDSEEEVEKELTFDKYYRMFKECTTTGQVEELNKKFMWNGTTLYEHLDYVELPTCKLFPVGCSSIKEIEEVVEKPRKTGLVGVKQIECVLPEEGVPEEDEEYYSLDVSEECLLRKEVYFLEWKVNSRILRAGWFKQVDREHAIKYFKALLNIED